MTKYDWKRISFDGEASHFFSGPVKAATHMGELVGNYTVSTKKL